MEPSTNWGDLSVSSELEKIIEGGKSDPKLSMVIFAVEIKALRESVDEMKATLRSDDARYYTNKDAAMLDKRVTRIEKSLLFVLGFVFLAVLTAIIGLVVVRPGGQ